VTRTLKLTLSYDGTDFAGWQFQPGQRTLQDTLEQALAKITGKFVRVMSSGRTDSGVHAFAQVVSFDTESELPADTIQRALNYELPHDMAALSVEEAPNFHARRDAKRKRYRYVIHDGPVRDVFYRRYAWQLFKRLDVPAMQRAAETLVGKHDFASFETAGSERETTERTVFALEVCRCGKVSPFASGQAAGSSLIGHAEGESSSTSPLTPALSPEEGKKDINTDLVQIEVECDGFLYNMVRIIAGTLAEVGQGKKPESWVAEVLAAHDRRRAGMTAPPQGLFLVRVEY
jgi:tRNA pseudouridine38-40 synthase